MSYITLNGTNYVALPPQGTTNTLTGDYIVNTDASSHVITDSSAGFIVAPFIARLCADASGTVGVVQQSTVEILDIDRIFDLSLNAVESAKILNAFVVNDLDLDGSADPSGHVGVTMATGAAVNNFKAQLAAAIASGSMNDASGTSLTNWLKAEAKADVTSLLNFDTLANLLEASVLSTFDIALDASGGADSMHTVMGAEGAEARRRTLFTQLNESRVEAYCVPSDGSNSLLDRVKTINFLPMVAGDTLALVFDVLVGDYTAGEGVNGADPSVGAKITRSIADAALTGTGAGANGADSYVIGGTGFGYANGTITISKPTMRRIAVQLHLGDGVTAGDPISADPIANATGDIQNGFVLPALPTA